MSMVKDTLLPAGEDTIEHPPLQAWCILELSWEYNDEYNYQPDNGGGTPVETYFDREKAERRCAELNAAAGPIYTYDDEADAYEVVPIMVRH